MISNHYQAMAVAYRRRSFSVVQGIGHGGLGMGALPSVPVSGAGPGPWGTIPPMPPVVGAPGCVQRLCPTVDSWADSWDMMTWWEDDLDWRIPRSLLLPSSKVFDFDLVQKDLSASTIWGPSLEDRRLPSAKVAPACSNGLLFVAVGSELSKS